VVTKTSKKDGALTILVQLLVGVMLLIWVPFFEMRFPTDPRIYFFLGLAIIFYTINDRVGTTVRRGIEASTFSMLYQASTVFLVIIGLLFFGEPFVFTKIIGAILIIFSNILVFYKQGEVKLNKYIAIGILGQLSLATAISLDVGNAENFNIAFYMAVTYFVPPILIYLIERPKISDIKSEFINGNKKAILLTAFAWSITALTSIRAYILGSVTMVAPIAAVSVILNVFAGYIFLKERDNLLKKTIAAIVIIIGVVLIQL